MPTFVSYSDRPTQALVQQTIVGQIGQAVVVVEPVDLLGSVAQCAHVEFIQSGLTVEASSERVENFDRGDGANQAVISAFFHSLTNVRSRHQVPSGSSVTSTKASASAHYLV